MNSQPYNTLHTLDHLALIRISGEEASTFLQGQLTCDIRSLTEEKASIAAFCTPKGRVISTLLLLKNDAEFWLILPRSLLDKVIQKLRMYVLRSKVRLEEASATHAILGLCHAQTKPDFAFHAESFAVSRQMGLTVSLPSELPRFLCIFERDGLSALIATLESQGFVQNSAEAWRYQDISDGFPWFDIDRSEQFIPQMLNLERLGGISFNKGCYTGQEIVARTHYLGKAKRQLFVAACDHEVADDRPLAVLNQIQQEKCGDVLSLQNLNGGCRLLIVLQTIDEEAKRFILDDELNTELTLLPG